MFKNIFEKALKIENGRQWFITDKKWSELTDATADQNLNFSPKNFSSWVTLPRQKAPSTPKSRSSP